MKRSPLPPSFRKAIKNATVVLAHYMLNEGNMLICYSTPSITVNSKREKKKIKKLI